MESPRKFNDCYFYYYSTCTKGDNCVFRHEPSALGCETMCAAWQQGKCIDKRCKLRHMELRKNRKQIPCYWENQPGGCRKKHCPFMHKNPDARTDGIAPSQPAPPTSAQPVVTGSEPVPTEQPPLSGALPTVAAPAPAPVPLQLWQQQQQRQVVLDSSILNVLPASSELLGARRVMPAHAHPHAHAHAHAHAHDAPPNPYATMPVDPLVVNFEEESDNESAPSSTPTKEPSEDALRAAPTKCQELMLLEQIQAATAALLGYDGLAPPDTGAERKTARNNLFSKYDKVSLDEIAGHRQVVNNHTSLDFKILSLDEIRAKKRTSETTSIVHTAPIALNLNRKRKLSTQETVSTEGNKIIKVVRSNSIVYKQVDPPSVVCAHGKADSKQNDCNASGNRKRTLSEMSSDNIQHDNVPELVDNCLEFKKIKLAEQPVKPILIRNNSECGKTNDASSDTSDGASRVEIIDLDGSIDASDECTNADKTSDCEVVEDIVELSDEETDVTELDVYREIVKSVPDVVASCQKGNAVSDPTDQLIINIDALINEEL